MSRGKQRLWIDVGFITGLLALSAVPLVVGRHSPWLHETRFGTGDRPGMKDAGGKAAV